MTYKLQVFLAAFSFACWGQSAEQRALREVEDILAPVNDLVAAKDARALDVLEQAKRKLASLGPSLKDHFFVREALLDVFARTVEVQEKAGNRKVALEAVARICADGAGNDLLGFLLRQRGLNELQADPEYARATSDCRRSSTVWQSGPRSLYAPKLPVEDRLAGLAKLWSEVKYNFYDPRRLADIGWDQIFTEYIGHIMRTETTEDYYRRLQEMVAKVGDGHTGVSPPIEIEQARANPPIRIGLVENSVLILDVLNKPLRDEGVVPGVEILEIDGLPVHEHAKKNVMPFIGQSTKQGLESVAYSYALMRADAARPMRVKLQDANGRTWERDLPRQGFEWERRPRPSVAGLKLLEGGIGLFYANSFESSKVATVFEDAMPEIQETHSLIVDLRENGGGSDGIGIRILACLTDKPFLGSQQRLRHYIPTMRARGLDLDFKDMEQWLDYPNGKLLYTKPVAVLTSANTASAAEDFVVRFRAMKRGIVIGQPTFGSTGLPIWFSLPGGGTGRVCTKQDRAPDGSQFVGVGVIPDIAAQPTVASIRSGRDNVLDAAVRYLKGIQR